MSDYEAFLGDKFVAHKPSGISGGFNLPSSMFGHQSALTSWALRRGRAAVFADTGLGKMLIELAWADVVNKHTGMPVMIHTPLAMAAQIAAEGRKFGIEATVVREANEVTHGINITNYDRLHKFDTSIFGGIVLDESGCIKHHDAKTFRLLTDAYMHTPFKLPATATPAPNDWTELGTHAEFLGICTRAEMLAEFFTHDGGDTSVWVLKGHARAIFWRWVASWGAMIRKPSDLGFDDGAYNLPPLNLHEHTVDSNAPLNGMLFAMEAQTLSERRGARRASMDERVAACVETVFKSWGNDGLETGTRGKQKSARGGRPDAAGKEDCICPSECAERPGSQESVPERVLPGQQAQVRQEDARAKGCVQRQAAGAVCGKSGVARAAQGDRQAVAGEESNQEESAATSPIWAERGSVRLDDGGSERGMCDMSNGADGSEDVPNGGSLPHDRKGEGPALLPVQHGAGEIQGQPGVTGCGNRLLEPWIIWVELNAEQDELEKAFGALAFSVRGSQTTEEKEDQLSRWLASERPVMISKASMLGYGINMQLCAKVAFLGVTDSFESYYQAVRRCWRFGQTRSVDVHLFSSSQEGAVAANLKRKERDAKTMAEAMSAETHDAVFAEVIGEAKRETNIYGASKRVAIPSFITTEAA